MLRWERDPGDNRNYNRSRYDSGSHYGDPEDSAASFNYAPGRILGFVAQQGKAATNGIFAIVQSCFYSHKRQSVFTVHWKLEDPRAMEGVHIVDVEAIVRPCLMLPVKPMEGLYQEIWTTERWAHEFIDSEYWGTET